MRRKSSDPEGAADPDALSCEIVGDMDAHTAEALRLEIRRLARLHGVTVGKLSVEVLDTWWAGRQRGSPSRSRRSTAKR